MKSRNVYLDVLRACAIILVPACLPACGGIQWRNGWIWLPTDSNTPVRGWAAFGFLLGLTIELPHHVHFALDPLLYALLFTAILLLLVDAGRIEWVGFSILSWVARISYSVYLTHALVIHAFTRLIQPHEFAWGFWGLCLQLVLIFTTGWVFSQLFEKTAFQLRDKWVPA